MNSLTTIRLMALDHRLQTIDPISFISAGVGHVECSIELYSLANGEYPYVHRLTICLW